MVIAKLYYRYGAMNSGKSMEVIKVAYNYMEQNKNVIVLKSSTDNRSGAGVVESRAGFCYPSIDIKPTDSIDKELIPYFKQLSCILVDEAQFLTEKQVISLSLIVDDLDIPVIAFGLKNDFRNELFEGSKALLVYADKIQEIKTVCWDCSSKAIMNSRFQDGVLVTEGEQIDIGGNDKYIPLCRKCYNKYKDKQK